ncbi:MAG: response regulator [Cyanobacteria bacterium P01_H01_bin.121]
MIGKQAESENGHRAKILVVDDEAAVRRILDMRLSMAGFKVVTAIDGEEALEVFQREAPDLVVLDIMLPKLDGYGVCRQLRQESEVPIIMLSALGAIADRITGLDLGADDYLAKPFSPKELEARINSILRRIEDTSPAQAAAQGLIQIGRIQIDTNRRQVFREGERVSLTYTEFSLLEMLFRNPGQTVPRAQILQELWGYPPRRAADLRVVDVYVARLRSKLEVDARNPELIITVRGIGYTSQKLAEVSETARA